MTRGRARRGPTVSRWHDEDGATVALLLFSFFALLGVALLAIDGGLLFLSQRGQVPDTDAGALAAARHLIEFPCATQAQVDAAATSLIEANDTTSSLLDRDPGVPGDNVRVRRRGAAAPCDVNTTVVVATRREAAGVFAGAFGFGPIETTVSSSAEVVAPTAVADVLPIAVCELDEHVVEWQAYIDQVRDGVGSRAAALVAYGAVADPDHVTATYAGAQTPVHRLALSEPNDCGLDGPGNWGLVDFDGDGGLGNTVAEGYGPGVTLATPGAPATYDCDAADAGTDDCPIGPLVDPGVLATLDAAWRCPASTPTIACEVSFVTLHDGGDATAYSFTGIMPMVLRGVGQNEADEPYIDVELVDGTVPGPGVGVPAGYTGPLGVSLCGAGDYDNCNQ